MIDSMHHTTTSCMVIICVFKYIQNVIQDVIISLSLLLLLLLLFIASIIAVVVFFKVINQSNHLALIVYMLRVF